jgi:hypothetical protein
MKILLDVSRELLNGEWVPCAGVKLQEQPHGSFALLYTGDVEWVRRAGG